MFANEDNSGTSNVILWVPTIRSIQKKQTTEYFSLQLLRDLIMWVPPPAEEEVG